MSESNMQKMQIPYTPTTEEVRDGWVEVQNAWWPGCPDNWDDLKAAEFDRWLAEVKAQAWEEGWVSCFHAYWHKEENPYRKERK